MHQKHRLFCEEYIKDFNGTEAYYRAGYKPKTRRSAEASAFNLLRKTEIKLYISQLTESISKENGITVNRTLQELGSIAFSNLKQLSRWNEREGVVFKSSEELADDIASAIASVKTTPIFSCDGKTVRYQVELKLHNKMAALDRIVRYLSLDDDFNSAVLCLQNKYGIKIWQDNEGQWKIEQT